MFKYGKQQVKQKIKKKTVLPSEVQTENLCSNLSINEQTLKNIFKNCSDFTIQPIQINGEPKILIVLFRRVNRHENT